MRPGRSTLTLAFPLGGQEIGVAALVVGQYGKYIWHGLL